MGLKASTTCELTFGGERPAVGTLVGDVHDGIRQMFVIIEFARMMVGTKAIATLSAGYLTALDYARTRVQGADLTQLTDKTAPRVTIIHHPDVRRLLMLQKAYAEGMRALVLYTATFQDTLQIAEAAGRPDDAGRRGQRPAAAGRQGSGLRAGLRDADPLAADPRWLRFPAGLPDRAVHQGREDRQPVRGHHGDPGHGPVLPQDRQERGPGARLPARPDQGVRRRARPATAGSRPSAPRWPGPPTTSRPWWPRCTDSWSTPPSGRQEIYRVGLNTTRLLLALGDLIVGWLLARQAEVAQARLDEGRRREAGRRPGLLRREDRHRAVLRRDRAAQARHRAGDRRGDHPGPDGTAGGGVLTAEAVRARAAKRSRDQAQASMRRGSSSIAPMSRSTAEPRSPSTMRWSKDSASVRDLAHGQLPLVHPRGVLDLAEGQDRGLARGEDGRAGVHAEHADVGDRDRAAAHVGRAWPCRPGRSRSSPPSARARPGSESACASLTFGTTSPRSVAAAMPRFT